MKKYLIVFVCTLLSGLVLSSCSRSDFEITTDVKQAVVYEYPAVTVEVRNGIVNLGGTIDSEENKATMEKVIREISGVKNVNNDVSIEVPVQAPSKDDEIRALIEQGLQGLEVQDSGVQVFVEGEVVTLKGKVSVANQKKVLAVVNSVKTNKVVNEMKK